MTYPSLGAMQPLTTKPKPKLMAELMAKKIRMPSNIVSSGSLTSTRRRNRLDPEMFEALQILKSAYRNGHIHATDQAEAHIAAFLDSLDIEDDEENI